MPDWPRPFSLAKAGYPRRRVPISIASMTHPTPLPISIIVVRLSREHKETTRKSD